MHPTDVKSKPHTIQARVLFLIMLIFSTPSSSNARQGECFGGVSQQNIVEKMTGGFLSVYKKSVTLTCSPQHNPLYIITALEGGFYIFDNKANKFICWKNKNVAPMNFRMIKRKDYWKKCKFQDHVDSRQDAYIYFTPYGHKDVKLKVHLKKLKYGGSKSTQAFLKFPTKECNCTETYELFCRTRLKNMAELSKVCKKDSSKLCN